VTEGEGLYFCVRKQGSPYWMIRYTTAKGRREATLGQFPLMSLADARIAAVQAEITSLESELAEVRSKMAALLKDIVPNEAQSNTTEVAE